MKLKHKLPLLNTVLLILGFVILWLGIYRLIFPVMIESERKMAVGEMRAQTTPLEHLILQGKIQLELIEDHPLVKKMNWEEIEPYFMTKVEEGIFNKIGIVYLDKTYHITGSSNRGDLSERAYLDQIFKGESIVSEPLYSKSDGAYQIVIGLPIFNEEILSGAIIGTILMEEIEEIIYGLHINGKGYGFLTNKYGEILLHPQYESLIHHNILSYVQSKEDLTSVGYLKYIGIDGREQHAFYNQLETTEWFVVISVAEEELYRPINQLLTRTFLYFVVVLLVLYIGLNRIIKYFLSPLDRLIESMKRAEQGEYTLSIPVNRKDEIGEIGIGFNKMMEGISLRDEELQAYNQELAASFEEINDANERLLLAHGEIAKNLQYQKLINEIGEKLYRIQDLDELLHTILLHTQEIINGEQSAVYFYDGECNLFKIRSALNYSKEELDILQFKKEEGTFRWILENKQELFIENIHKDDRFLSKLNNVDKFPMLLELPILDEKDEVMGVIHYAGDRLNLSYTPFLKQLSKMISMTIQNSQLIEAVKETYFQTIIALVKAIEFKDSYTRGHSERVMNYSLSLGRKLGLSNKEMNALKHGSILHDIGKLGIPDYILGKTGKLTDGEYALMKKHAEIGESFVSNLKFLEEVRPIIRSHHERIDGRGYPDGLSSEGLSVLTKIVSIADAYDAMTSERSYRPPMTQGEALAELKKNSNTQFDGELVEAFIKLIIEDRI